MKQSIPPKTIMTESDSVLLKNGLKIYPFVSFSQLIDFAMSQKKILIAINAEKILHTTDQTRSIVNANIGYCDGTGAVMALKRHHAAAMKISGCELWLQIVDAMYPQEKTFYLMGGKQEVIDSTVEKLRLEKPGIQIVGYRNGYIQSNEERQALLADIAEKKPDIVFVAMGSPKQELLMQEMMQFHKAVYQGLGGSFDVYVGKAKRAPRWWLDHSLEWLYRLLKQPSRINRQIHLVRFLINLKLGKY